jgi:hypothetical protein
MCQPSVQIFLTWGKTPAINGVLPQHFTVNKKIGGLVASSKKGQSSKSNFNHNSYKFLRKFGAFDFTQQTLRTVKDQNIWRQFLQLPQTL